MNENLEQILNLSIVKKHFGWKIAICQHPMYLLIDEDRGEPTVGERVPPWGAPDAKEYVERVSRNLNSLEKYPDLKLNYEFSGVEMFDMNREFPTVVKKMKKYYDKGSLDFLDGSFSQAHLQVFGSESNWRQIEFGWNIFKELFGKEVKVYACQETGISYQLPQILKQFGYEFVVLPPFPWAIEITEGKMEMVGFFRGPDTIAGDEFLDAEALDGTTLPVYAKIIDAQENIQSEFISEEVCKDLYSGPSIWTFFPDMIEIDEKIHNEFNKLFDIVLLESALKNRLPQAPPRSKARIYTYWSYIEGVWAEELLRKNKLAEEYAVLAESIYCMGKLAGLSVNKRDEFKRIWHTILKYQHHDVYWIEVTDLRRKAINYLDDVINQCHKIMSDVAVKLIDKNEECVTVFNALPVRRRCLIEVSEDMVPVKSNSFQKFKNKCFGFVELQADSYESFNISKSDISSEEIPLQDEISTDKYKVKLSDTGLIKQITIGKNETLLKDDSYLGGEIRALISDNWVDNRSADCKFYTGDVAYILERKSSLADIPVLERYFFFKTESCIKAEIEFDFSGNTVGNFWLDETKINIYYPTKDSEIYHDIPFGYVSGRERRALFATNWLYCGGLVYVNRGTVKHWVKDGVIANLIAWGGNSFSNRMHLGWAKCAQYDIRLYGKQKIEYFLIPFGKFNGNKIVKDVSALTFPVFITKGKGEKLFYQLKDKELAITSIYDKDDEVWVRGYKLPSSAKSRFRNWEIFNLPLKKLT